MDVRPTWGVVANRQSGKPPQRMSWLSIPTHTGSGNTSEGKNFHRWNMSGARLQIATNKAQSAPLTVETLRAVATGTNEGCRLDVQDIKRRWSHASRPSVEAVLSLMEA